MSTQPLPTPGREGVTEAVIADLRAREQQGIATYGRSLETFNGRNALRDAYEELLDSVQYCRQLLMQVDEWLAVAGQDGVCASVPACILAGRPCTEHTDTLRRRSSSSRDGE